MSLKKLGQRLTQNSSKIIIILLTVVASYLLTICFSINKDNIKTTTLKNNLDIIINQNNSDLVSIQGWVKTGTINETAQNNGISHFLEHMIFKKKNYIAEIEQLGGYFNAATSYDFTYYYITLPKKHVKRAISILGELLFNNNFDQNDFQQEKKVILEEIARNNDNPHNTIQQIILEKTYRQHPYGQKILGNKKNIQKFALKDLQKYYAEFYAPNNTTLVIAGNISEKKLRKTFKTLEQYTAKQTQSRILREPPKVTSRYFFRKKIKNLKTPYLFYAYSVPGIYSKDSYILDVLLYFLGNSENAFLNRELRDKQNLTNSITVSYQTKKKRSLFIVKIPVKNTYAANKIDNHYQKSFKNISISINELNLIKQKIKFDYLKKQENIENRAFGLGYYNTLDSYLYETNYLYNIDKVTLKDIYKVIDKYFNQSNKFLFSPGK